MRATLKINVSLFRTSLVRIPNIVERTRVTTCIFTAFISTRTQAQGVYMISLERNENRDWIS